MFPRANGASLPLRSVSTPSSRLRQNAKLEGTIYRTVRICFIKTKNKKGAHLGANYEKISNMPMIHASLPFWWTTHCIFVLKGLISSVYCNENMHVVRISHIPDKEVIGSVTLDFYQYVYKAWNWPPLSSMHIICCKEWVWSDI